MSFAEQWLRRPQNLWLRRALFQVHLWTGIGLGIYVLLISVSGSAIVFRNEVYNKFGSKPTIVGSHGPHLTDDQLKEAAHKAYPGYAVTFIWKPKDPSQATEIWMDRNGKQKQRLFDPFTGKDLGPSVPLIIRVVAWMSDFHTNLLFGEKGRLINGAGAVFLTLLSITGAIIWWPGVKNWRRGLTIQRKANWKRINWDLHSALGFWTFLFIFMWSFTGIYVVFPTPFQKLINSFAPLDYYRLVSQTDAPDTHTPVALAPGTSFVLVADSGKTDIPRPRRRFRPRYSAGDKIVRWFTYLHFGNFAGWKTKALWAVLGLAPVFLFFTGVLMWWNRVLSKEARRLRHAPGPLPAASVT